MQYLGSPPALPVVPTLAASSPKSIPTPLPLLPSMVSADFCTAAVLISSGAVLGRVNPIQLLLMTLLEVPLFACNEFILLSLLGVSGPPKIRLATGLLPPPSGPIPTRVSCTHQISDSGGSLTVHAFGAYFGLMVSRALRALPVDEGGEQQDAGRQPDAFTVLGTELQPDGTGGTGTVLGGRGSLRPPKSPRIGSLHLPGDGGKSFSSCPK